MLWFIQMNAGSTFDAPRISQPTLQCLFYFSEMHNRHSHYHDRSIAIWVCLWISSQLLSHLPWRTSGLLKPWMFSGMLQQVHVAIVAFGPIDPQDKISSKLHHHRLQTFAEMAHDYWEIKVLWLENPWVSKLSPKGDVGTSSDEFTRNMTHPSRQAGSPTLTSGVMEVALNRPKELNASGEPKSQNEENHHFFIHFCWISAKDWAPKTYLYFVISHPIKTRAQVSSLRTTSSVFSFFIHCSNFENGSHQTGKVMIETGNWWIHRNWDTCGFDLFGISSIWYSAARNWTYQTNFFFNNQTKKGTASRL